MASRPHDIVSIFFNMLEHVSATGKDVEYNIGIKCTHPQFLADKKEIHHGFFFHQNGGMDRSRPATGEVSNLTLMALGSSAPEILLSIIEL